jgi:hypothetical protein
VSPIWLKKQLKALFTVPVLFTVRAAMGAAADSYTVGSCAYDPCKIEDEGGGYLGEGHSRRIASMTVSRPHVAG